MEGEEIAMHRPLAILTTALLLSTPAHAFLARNGLVVQPDTTSSFEIPYRGLSGARHFWCAAGDYVVRELHLPPDTRIFRLSNPPRRSGQGIRFSLSSEGATKTGLIQFGSRRSVTASHARHLCDLEVLFDR